MSFDQCPDTEISNRDHTFSVEQRTPDSAGVDQFPESTEQRKRVQFFLDQYPKSEVRGSRHKLSLEFRCVDTPSSQRNMCRDFWTMIDQHPELERTMARGWVEVAQPDSRRPTPASDRDPCEELKELLKSGIDMAISTKSICPCQPPKDRGVLSYDLDKVSIPNKQDLAPKNKVSILEKRHVIPRNEATTPKTQDLIPKDEVSKSKNQDLIPNKRDSITNIKDLKRKDKLLMRKDRKTIQENWNITTDNEDKRLIDDLDWFDSKVETEHCAPPYVQQK